MTRLLGIEFPLFAFSHCRDVVAAVTNAGGFGVLGAIAYTPERLDAEPAWIDRQVRGRPYAVDVLVPGWIGPAAPGGVARAREAGVPVAALVGTVEHGGIGAGRLLRRPARPGAAGPRGGLRDGVRVRGGGGAVGRAVPVTGYDARMVGNPPELERGTGVPAHVQIERWLLDSIAGGDMAPGDRLPGERELAGRLGVSRMTLRQALATLERDGVLVRVPGRTGGAFVAEPRIERDLTGLAGFTEQVRRVHLRAEARILTAATVPAPAAVAAALRVEPGSPVHEVARVRSAGRSPLALERSFFPALPGFLAQDLTGSLYALLADGYGLAPRTALEHLDPVIAGPAEAAELGIEPGAPLMRVERTAYAADGAPVEHARDLFRPDRVRISVRSGVT
ncbi:UTRA domain-containing protein [Nonomuraea sp. ATR24]|uniref:UTRA domain-containing protein n=1 Tax=Nonomuraea sp. ATR24 TaxID=1676744 RepID=UPI0035C06445